MSKKRFYYEISIVLAFMFIVFGCLVYAYAMGSKTAIATAMIGVLAAVSSTINLISHFSEIDRGRLTGIYEEEDANDK